MKSHGRRHLAYQTMGHMLRAASCVHTTCALQPATSRQGRRVEIASSLRLATRDARGTLRSRQGHRPDDGDDRFPAS